MSRCTDCRGGTPAPLWKRCEVCSYERLRILVGMEPGRAPERRFKAGDLVTVVTSLGKRGPVLGKIARAPKGKEYVVEVEGGGRCYVRSDELRERHA